MATIPGNIHSPSSQINQSSHFYTTLLLLCWFGMVSVLGYSGFFIPEVDQPPVVLLISGLLTLTGFTLAYRYLPAFRTYVLQLDMRLSLCCMAGAPWVWGL